jgi:exonuclease SbcC
MKILQISFRNLNSLTGDWHIDFTHKAFVSDGIFAITGPTGAGKSTILDAICLALYGRTPRLERVNKAGNEIMSRKTGDCAAEVTFETEAGCFRCHFSQRRAHKKPDGALQDPVHEIVDVHAPAGIENRKKDVARRVEEVTGMDFDRFTRSMLLAQGGFAAFLEAKPDERAPILEQITGTAIYSAISLGVHGRFSEEKKKLESLASGLKHIQLLSEEALLAEKTLLGEKSLREALLKGAWEETSAFLAWRRKIAGLEVELLRMGTEKEALLQRQQAFLPEAERLERAQRALELGADYAGLLSLRREDQRDAEILAQCQEKLPGHERALGEAVQALDAGLFFLEKKKEESREQQHLLREVRALDLRLQEKEAPIRSASEVLDAEESALRQVQADHKKDERLLSEAEGELLDLGAFLTRQAADAALVTELTGLSARMEDVRRLHGERENLVQAGIRAEEEVGQAEKKLKDSRRFLEKALAQEKALEGSLGEKRAFYRIHLLERELSDWQKDFWRLKEERGLLQGLEKHLAGLRAEAENLLAMEKRKSDLGAEKEKLAGLLDGEKAKKAGLEREAELLDIQLGLLRRIRDFEEARGQLKDGEACPLCGATDHPFAQGNIPKPDATAEALKEVRRHLKAAEGRLSRLGVQEAELRKDLEQLDILSREALARKKGGEEAIRSIQETLGWELSFDALKLDALEKALPGFCAEKEALFLDAGKRVETGETLEKEIRRLSEDLEKKKALTRDGENTLKDALHREEKALLTRTRLQEEQALLETRHAAALRGLEEALEGYGMGKVAVSRLETFERELVARKKAWCEASQKKEGLGSHIHTLKIRLSHLEGEMARLGKGIGEKKEALSRLLEERDSLASRRRQLFEGKNPDREEARMAAAQQEAEKAVEGLRSRVEQAKEQRNRLMQQMEGLRSARTLRQEPLSGAEREFIAKYLLLGFCDEESYRRAALGEEERNALRIRAEGLKREEAELLAREAEKRLFLEREREKALTGEPEEVLLEGLGRLEEERARVQQEMGAIRQKLSDNDSLKEKFAAEKAAAEAQEAICGQWSHLHSLIGSSDGKKYRNFAQGLTFEVMVQYANQELSKMTDRYLLIRDSRMPLELNVVDSYQAGEIRSTRNLSGGERFIVSLALALGLSRMAGSRVRVDSLFLDEGFGTLDAEALDTALETLAGLHRNGKLIGIISHVPMIRERMGTRIQVIPRIGGRSEIRGPGCVRGMNQDTDTLIRAS